MPYLVEWQKRRDYTVRLSCELMFNVVEYPGILELMREAFMTNIFIGIETVDPDALRAMSKKQNVRTPMLEAVETVNSSGIEIAAGIIIGLDTDTPETTAAILEFIEASQIPIVTPNLLVALPHTPLYERLQKANRLNSGEGRDSNVECLLPYKEEANWKRVIRETYEHEIFMRAMLGKPREPICTAGDQCVHLTSSHGLTFGGRLRFSYARLGESEFVVIIEKNSGK